MKLAGGGRDHYPAAVLRRARQIGVLFIVALLVVETAGVARAFGRGARVSCCCGTHATARPCKCKRCPAARQHARDDGGGDRLAAGRDCDGDVVGDEVLKPLAVVTRPLWPRLRRPGRRLPARVPAAPTVRLIEAERPPP